MRNFTVLNELCASCLVAIDFGTEPELLGSTPASQVIPPGSSAGFDIVFKSNEPVSFRRTVKYVLNGVHAFKFTVTAEVVPIELAISTDELIFVFPDGWTDQTMNMPLTLTNSGTSAAKFNFTHVSSFSGRRQSGGGLGRGGSWGGDAPRVSGGLLGSSGRTSGSAGEGGGRGLCWVRCCIWF